MQDLPTLYCPAGMSGIVQVRLVLCTSARGQGTRPQEATNHTAVTASSALPCSVSTSPDMPTGGLAAYITAQLKLKVQADGSLL